MLYLGSIDTKTCAIQNLFLPDIKFTRCNNGSENLGHARFAELQITEYLFLCILFSFFCPVRPTLPHAIFSPRIPSFWDLTSTLSRREKGTCRGWVLGTVLDGFAAQEKKENVFFFGARKRVR